MDFLKCVKFQFNAKVSVSGHWKWVRPAKYTFELHQNGCQATLISCLWENVLIIYRQLPFWKIGAFPLKISDPNTWTGYFWGTFALSSGVFLYRESSSSRSCCVYVREGTLTFPKHQKLLKTVKNSWRNLHFSAGVDDLYMNPLPKKTGSPGSFQGKRALIGCLDPIPIKNES